MSLQARKLKECIFASQQLSSTTKKEISWNLLKYRFENAHTIPGTQKIHAYKPVSKECAEVHEFSTSHIIQQERVTIGVTLLDNIPMQKDISGYNPAEYDGFWWLGCVLESWRVKVNVLHPQGHYPVNVDGTFIHVYPSK